MHIKRSLVGILIVLTLFITLPNAHAAEQTGGSGLSISPTRSELTINAGKSDVIEITLKNISGVDIKAGAVINDFESNNETGDPKIITDISSQSPTSIRDFLIGVEDMELKKDEIKKFTIPVQIPDNTPSGAYYGVIRYTAEPVAREDATEKQVSLNASLGLIVLIQVPGDITEQVQAQRIAVERNGRISSLFVSPPLKVDVTLKNTGNGFTKPYGKVIVTKGGKEVYSYEMNNTDPRSNILPGASRTFKDDLKNVDGLGRYTVTANISYGKGGDILTLKSSFWVLPLWFVLTVLAALIALIVAGLLVYKRLSKHRLRRR